MEKMRVSARECRKRKKAGIKGLEAKLQKYVQKDKRSSATIDRLQDEMAALRALLAAGQKVALSDSTPVESMSSAVPQQFTSQQQYEADAPSDMMQFESIAEDGPYETYTTVLNVGPRGSSAAPSLFEKRRSRATPPKLNIDVSRVEEACAPHLELTASYRLTPLTPLTAGFKLDDLQLIPGFALPTPEPCQVGGVGFSFNCLDAEISLLV
jgi:hypothetical protein